MRSLVQRGQTLIATLIAVAIVLILAVVLLKGYVGGLNGGPSPRKDNLGATVPGLVRLDAQDQVCQSDLGQVRAAIQLFHNSNGDEGYPAKLEDLKIGANFYRCPVGGEAYVYDPTTGKVHCPHPGHEKY